MVCMAVIRALKKQAGANAHFFDDHMRVFQKVHLGFAVDTERGLMVPVVHNADDLTLEGLSSQMKSLAEQCRKGSIDPSLIASEAASFTVSNLGAYGVEMFTPVINLPQTGILGVNTIINRPAPLENGAFGFIPYIGLSLTYDHRALDGGPASLFLKTIKEEIENFQVS
jgi:pyruvate dehydrogenase E2 component (dihydrolipoamide acetyltransferase)